MKIFIDRKYIEKGRRETGFNGLSQKQKDIVTGIVSVVEKALIENDTTIEEALKGVTVALNILELSEREADILTKGL